MGDTDLFARWLKRQEVVKINTKEVVALIENCRRWLEEQEGIEDTPFKVGDIVYLKSDTKRANPMTVAGFDTGNLDPETTEVHVFYTTAQRVIINTSCPSEALEK